MMIAITASEQNNVTENAKLNENKKLEEKNTTTHENTRQGSLRRWDEQNGIGSISRSNCKLELTKRPTLMVFGHQVLQYKPHQILCNTHFPGLTANTDPLYQ